MAAVPPPKDQMRQWLENWKAVDEAAERIKADRLRALTEEQSAEEFNGLDCDPSLVWTPESRRESSGLIEQQRLFSQAYRHAPGPRRRS